MIDPSLNNSIYLRRLLLAHLQHYRNIWLRIFSNYQSEGEGLFNPKKSERGEKRPSRPAMQFSADQKKYISHYNSIHIQIERNLPTWASAPDETSTLSAWEKARPVILLEWPLSLLLTCNKEIWLFILLIRRFVHKTTRVLISRKLHCKSCP